MNKRMKHPHHGYHIPMDVHDEARMRLNGWVDDVREPEPVVVAPEPVPQPEPAPAEKSRKKRNA